MISYKVAWVVLLLHDIDATTADGAANNQGAVAVGPFLIEADLGNANVGYSQEWQEWAMESENQKKYSFLLTNMTQRFLFGHASQVRPSEEDVIDWCENGHSGIRVPVVILDDLMFADNSSPLQNRKFRNFSQLIGLPLEDHLSSLTPSINWHDNMKTTIR